MKKKTKKVTKLLLLSLVLIGSVLFGANHKAKVAKPLVTCLYLSTNVFDEIVNKVELSGNTITLYRISGGTTKFVNVSCRVLYPTKDGQYK